ncbi:hypothetical protein HS7_11700 [Sulfolobales archaeon HS-7]|nr:hypothetical protein HS7_11700 [Sulfolobales archaeon HS-7]
MDDLAKSILIHIYKYGPDSPWYMARRLNGKSGYSPVYDEEAIEKVCKQLVDLGYLEVFRGQLKRSPTSSVKPWLKVKARMMDGKPKGVYYQLTKEGKKVASKLYKGT